MKEPVQPPPDLWRGIRHALAFSAAIVAAGVGLGFVLVALFDLT